MRAAAVLYEPVSRSVHDVDSASVPGPSAGLLTVDEGGLSLHCPDKPGGAHRVHVCRGLDRVFGHGSTAADVYGASVLPLVAQAVDGGAATVVVLGHEAARHHLLEGGPENQYHGLVALAAQGVVAEAYRRLAPPLPSLASLAQPVDQPVPTYRVLLSWAQVDPLRADVMADRLAVFRQQPPVPLAADPQLRLVERDGRVVVEGLRQVELGGEGGSQQQEDALGQVRSLLRAFYALHDRHKLSYLHSLLTLSVEVRLSSFEPCRRDRAGLPLKTAFAGEAAAAPVAVGRLQFISLADLPSGGEVSLSGSVRALSEHGGRREGQLNWLVSLYATLARLGEGTAPPPFHASRLTMLLREALLARQPALVLAVLDPTDSQVPRLRSMLRLVESLQGMSLPKDEALKAVCSLKQRAAKREQVSQQGDNVAVQGKREQAQQKEETTEEAEETRRLEAVVRDRCCQAEDARVSETSRAMLGQGEGGGHVLLYSGAALSPHADTPSSRRSHTSKPPISQAPALPRQGHEAAPLCSSTGDRSDCMPPSASCSSSLSFSSIASPSPVRVAPMQAPLATHEARAPSSALPVPATSGSMHEQRRVESSDLPPYQREHSDQPQHQQHAYHHHQQPHQQHEQHHAMPTWMHTGDFDSTKAGRGGWQLPQTDEQQQHHDVGLSAFAQTGKGASDVSSKPVEKMDWQPHNHQHDQQHLAHHFPRVQQQQQQQQPDHDEQQQASPLARVRPGKSKLLDTDGKPDEGVEWQQHQHAHFSHQAPEPQQDDRIAPVVRVQAREAMVHTGSPSVAARAGRQQPHLDKPHQQYAHYPQQAPQQQHHDHVAPVAASQQREAVPDKGGSGSSLSAEGVEWRQLQMDKQPQQPQQQQQPQDQHHAHDHDEAHEHQGSDTSHPVARVQSREAKVGMGTPSVEWQQPRTNDHQHGAQEEGPHGHTAPREGMVDTGRHGVRRQAGWHQQQRGDEGRRGGGEVRRHALQEKQGPLARWHGAGELRQPQEKPLAARQALEEAMARLAALSAENERLRRQGGQDSCRPEHEGEGGSPAEPIKAQPHETGWERGQIRDHEARSRYKEVVEAAMRRMQAGMGALRAERDEAKRAADEQASSGRQPMTEVEQLRQQVEEAQALVAQAEAKAREAERRMAMAAVGRRTYQGMEDAWAAASRSTLRHEAAGALLEAHLADMQRLQPEAGHLRHAEAAMATTGFGATFRMEEGLRAEAESANGRPRLHGHEGRHRGSRVSFAPEPDLAVTRVFERTLQEEATRRSLRSRAHAVALKELQRLGLRSLSSSKLLDYSVVRSDDELREDEEQRLEVARRLQHTLEYGLSQGAHQLDRFR